MRLPTAFIAICICASATAVQAQTVAYWRFEDGVDKQRVEPKQKIRDHSGNHNELETFSADTAPTYSTNVPFATVQQSGEPNAMALDTTATPGARQPTRDLYSAHAGDGFDLNKTAIGQWTIEASVMFKPVANWETRWQTFVGRDGYNVPNKDAAHEDPLANLGFKKRGDNNHFSIEAFDSSGQYVGVQSLEPVQPDVWYHVAAVSDGKSLTLFVKGPADKEYVRQNSAPFRGALANSRDAWTIGRGCFANSPAEQCFGLIDEVRISAVALPTELMLTSPPPRDGATTRSVPTTAPAVAAPDEPPSPQRTYPPVSDQMIHPHDPSIIRVGEIYHVFASHEGFSHWRSKDLLRWEKLPGVFGAAPDWAKQEINPQPGMWAPEVAFFDGRYHMYYSVSRFGSQRSAIGLAVNESLDPEDPKYKWIDRGKVLESSRGLDFNAIDPAVVVDADGTPWLAWGSFIKGIYARRVDPRTGLLSADDATVHHLAARGNGGAIEAPYLMPHGEWYYLFVSYDFCCRGVRSTYKLMVGRSRNVGGPYVDRDGKPMLEGNASLLLRGHEYHTGPGQCAVTRQGDREVLIHHYYDGRSNGIPSLAVRPLYWDADGWPLVGEPIAEQSPAAPTRSLSGKWMVWDDYGKSFDLELRPDGRAIGPLGEGSWVLDEKELSMTWKPRADAPPLIDRCFVADDHDSYVGRRTDGTIVRGIRVSK